MEYNIIYLNGFMAAGKTTIGPILANTLGWDFYDLDKVIEEESGKRIVDIFSDEGEKYFREKETEILIKLSKFKDAVISLGGGTSANSNNMEIIKNSGRIIYLKASPESLVQRLRYKTDRPIFNDISKSGDKKAEMKIKIIQLLNQREPYYNQADLIINTDEMTLGMTVDKIAKMIIHQLFPPRAGWTTYDEKTKH
jgi:shikimate kinase